MSRGFQNGLFHGTVVAIVGLLVLMLAFPEHRTDSPAGSGADQRAAPKTQKNAPKPLDETKVPQSPPQNAVNRDPVQPSQKAASEPIAPAASAQTTAEPAASEIGLPQGSEFGRGGDVAPRIPALIAPRGSGATTEPSSVSVPAAEPAPVSIRTGSGRPEFDVTGPDSLMSSSGEPAAAVEVTQPEQVMGLSLPQPPDLSASELTDAIPRLRTDQDAPPAARENGPSEQDQDGETPELARPQLDLSLPPDLSDFNIQQRDEPNAP